MWNLTLIWLLNSIIKNTNSTFYINVYIGVFFLDITKLVKIIYILNKRDIITSDDYIYYYNIL